MLSPQRGGGKRHAPRRRQLCSLLTRWRLPLAPTPTNPTRAAAAALEAFQKAPPTTIFLLSLRSGAVGLNLTARGGGGLSPPLGRVAQPCMLPPSVALLRAAR